MCARASVRRASTTKRRVSGAVPLILYPTAGADTRQWRHLLAYPALRERFTMIAVDPPGHGKSLMPLDEPWWEQVYSATRDDLMGWVTGLVETLGLDRPGLHGLLGRRPTCAQPCCLPTRTVPRLRFDERLAAIAAFDADLRQLALP
jgi:hypothetical protein